MDGDGAGSTVMTHANRRGMLIGALLICAALAIGGCTSRQPVQTPSATQKVVGLWTNPSAKGRPASLSDIGFGQDGSFRHSGSNALGRPVSFGGRYQVGTSAEHSVIRLVYDDFPDKPTVWFFRLNGDTLTVAPSEADLDSEAAIVFKRAAQQ